MRLEEDLSEAHLRLARVNIEHLDWRECIRRYDQPHTLFYPDSPYDGTEGYGVEFGLEQYDYMAELMRTMQVKAIVSVNDTPEMRAAFKGFRRRRAELMYTVGGTGRAKKPAGELIILSW